MPGDDPARGLEDEVRAIRREVAALARRVRELESRGGLPARQDATPRPTPSEAPAPPAAAAPARAAARPHRDFERMLGANWLAVAGITVLVLGVAFFLKYAFEHDWIGLTARIALGIVTGLALIVTGDVLARRGRGGFGIFPHVLAGGGVAITYFSLFSAHFFEPYRAATGLTAGTATLLLALASLAFAAYAVGRDAPVLAGLAVVLATVTAFAAGAWTSVGVAYTLSLGAALAAAAAWKGWTPVTAVAAASTFLVLFVDVVREDANMGLVATASVLAVVVYAAAAFVIARTRAAPTAPGLVPVTVAASGILGWLIALAALTVGREGGTLADVYPNVDAWLTGLLALALLGAAAATRRARHGFAAGAAVAGVTVLIGWPPVAFDEQYVPLAWGLLIALAAAARAGDVASRALVRWGALAAGFVAVGALLVNAPDWVADAPGALANFLAFWVVALALGAAWGVERARSAPDDAEARVFHGLYLVGAVVAVTTHLGHALEGYWISAAWALEGLLLMAAGFALGYRDLRVVALGAFGLTLLRLFTFDLGTLDLGYRIVVFLVVGVLLLAASALYARERRRSPPPVASDAE